MATVPVPVTWTTGKKISAALLNTDVRDEALFWTTNRPFAEGIQNTAQGTLTASTWTDINFDAETIDRDGQHSTVTNTPRFVLGNTLGWYLVSAYLPWAGNTTGTGRRARLALNGTEINGTQVIVPPGSGGVSCVIPGKLIGVGTSTDYVTLQGFHDATTAIAPNVSGGVRAFLSAIWIGL